jgi:hypothetical protein
MARISFARHAAEGFSRIGRLFAVFQTAETRSAKLMVVLKARTTHHAGTHAGITHNLTFGLGENSAEFPLGGDLCSKFRAPNLGTSIGLFMCGASEIQ